MKNQIKSLGEGTEFALKAQKVTDGYVPRSLSEIVAKPRKSLALKVRDFVLLVGVTCWFIAIYTYYTVEPFKWLALKEENIDQIFRTSLVLSVISLFLAIGLWIGHKLFGSRL